MAEEWEVGIEIQERGRVASASANPDGSHYLKCAL